jgi:hypothetical protein
VTGVQTCALPIYNGADIGQGESGISRNGRSAGGHVPEGSAQFNWTLGDWMYTFARFR